MKRKQKQEQVYSLPASKPQQRQFRMPSNQDMAEVNRELQRIDREMTRGYEAAKAGRHLSDWMGSSGHINDDIVASWRLVTDRALELYQNNPLVQNYFQLLETNIVGPDGFIYRARTTSKVGTEYKPNVRSNDAMEWHLKQWSKRGVCELSGKHSFKSLMTLVVTTVAREGDAFIRRHSFAPTKKNPYGFALQLIATKRVDVGYNVPRNRLGVAIVAGIEVDANDVPIAYHLNHMNLGTQGRHVVQRERVPAEEMYHVYSQEHAEQLRGISWLHAVMLPLHQLQKFEDCTAVAARIGASKMGFFKRQSDDAHGAEGLSDGIGDDGQYVSQAEPGQFQILPYGWDFVPYTPDFPADAHAPYVEARKEAIANGLRLGKTTLFCQVEGVNYSSIRQDKIASQEMFKSLHAWFIESFVDPVIQEFVRQGFKNNAFMDRTGYRIRDVEIDGFLTDYTIQGRSWQWVDPKNDLEAMKIAKDLGIYSPAKLAEMMGEDIYVQMLDTAAVRDEAVRLNVYVDKMNDPEANAERLAVKEAAETQAAAQAAAAERVREDAREAAKTAKEAEVAAPDAAEDPEAAKAAQEEAARAAEMTAMRRDLADVHTMLRELLTRATAPVVVPVEEMQAEAEPAPVEATQEPVVEAVEEVAPAEPAEPTLEELEAAVASLDATVTAIAAELAATTEEPIDA